MKSSYKRWMLCIVLLTAQTLFGQHILQVNPGTQLYVGDNALITLHNMNFENNGVLTATLSSRFSFTGDGTSNTIFGLSAISFGNLEINRVSGTLRLSRNIDVLSQIRFTSGNIDLNGNNIFLGNDPNGELINENDNSHIIGSSGFVRKIAVLNAPANTNPGNIGIFITSSQNLSNTVIERYHHSVSNQSIRRVFKIIPANNTLLGGNLRFQYLDSELNGLDENLLTAFTSNDGVNWANRGGTINTTTKQFLHAAMNELSFITLALPNAALPVTLVGFDANCEKNQTVLNWQTAMEENSDHFEVQSSANGLSWINTGILQAKENSNVVTSYTFTDAASEKKYYRLKMVDKDGKFTYSKIITIDCSNDLSFINVYPNPCTDKLTIQLPQAGNNFALTIKDISGKTLQQKDMKQSGHNFSIDVSGLPTGLYLLQLHSASFSYTIKFIKTSK
jgi:hypothetical protein